MSKQLLFFVRNYNLNEDAPKNSNYAAASIGAPTRAQVFRYDVSLIDMAASLRMFQGAPNGSFRWNICSEDL